MWGVIIGILFFGWLVAKFMEGSRRVSGKRTIEHKCWGRKYCEICGEEMRRPRI